MAHSRNEKLENVYSARTDAERRTAYNDWAKSYDKDVTAFSIQLPYVGAAVFAHHIHIGAGPILDAGCGTGMHTLPLVMMGYGGFHGIDLSDGMLAIAEERGIYDSLAQMALGERLDFSDSHFSATYCIGCLAPGNGPPHALDEFLRITREGGLIIWSTHGHHNSRTQPYHDHRHRLTEEGRWRLEFETAPFISMPDGDPEIRHAVYVYKVSGK